MCGIVAYVGQREAYPVLIKGLKRLEYRGYDSAGIALMNNGLNVYKSKGKVNDLEEHIRSKVENLKSNIGIGHTRWATHGEPSDRNAHPHTSQSGDLVMIHNGIIENYDAIKTDLISKGHTFKSDTDSEVLIHFIEEIKNSEQCSLQQALRVALKRVVGAYVIVILSKDEPDTLYAARKGSPLVIGVGKNEHFLASDATPIIEYTNEVVYVNDYEIAIIRNDELILKNIKDEPQTPYIQKLDMKLAEIEKGGYDHFMLKEIFEQPNAVKDCLRGRLNAGNNSLVLGGIRKYADKLANARRIIITACGTSWHAGLIAEYIFEELCRIPVEVEYAHEFRYRNPIIDESDVVLAISQSGETADTLVAVEMAKEKGATIFGICNVVGSSLARTTHEGVYTHAGPEIGVASTKAFTAQLAVLSLIALSIAKKRNTLSTERYTELLHELEEIPSRIEDVLEKDKEIINIADTYKDYKSSLYLGRGFNFPVALEGALKLKEISYIHAEGCPGSEMKHGHIALVDENMPVVFIATKDKYYDKIVSNIQEVKARKGKVIAVITEGDTVLKSMVDHAIEVPDTDDVFMPMVSVVPLQLLAYHIGVMKGYNVDQPRNLAKSVTVE